MLPNHTSATESLDVMVNYTDNAIRDINSGDGMDDDDKGDNVKADNNKNTLQLIDNNDAQNLMRSTRLGYSETKFCANDERLNDKLSTNQVAIDEVTSAKMTILQKNDSFTVRRPSALNLKQLVTTTIANDADEVDGKISEKTQLNARSSDATSRINIGFRNLTYTANRRFCWNRGTKTILNGLNGEFRAGELTAVIGPSGAGKSSLLDVLSGYTTNLQKGSITINGRTRDLKLFRSQAAYIMQDDLLQAHITVYEAMYFSVNLKIGNQLKYAEKKQRIQEVLDAIGLYDNRYTKTGELSGGQRKRLAIALELVDNPQFMAFDEPTSGLDSSTSTQVVLLLKQLAQEGRTIVCTIHQPSALLFGLFDHLYAVAEGQCIYAGATQMLVPFLAELDLVCPRTYNPCDYLLEISTHDYGPHNDRLVKKIRNGSSSEYRTSEIPSSAQAYSMTTAAKMMEDGLVTPIHAPAFLSHEQSPVSPSVSPSDQSPSLAKKPKIISLQMTSAAKCCGANGTYATSFFRQWYLLMVRNLICLRRDPALAFSRIVIHLCISLLVGMLYFNIGDDAALMYDNFKYIFLSIMFLMFTAFSTMTIIFPLDLPIVTREHFNRWYSIKAYYFAMTFADLPLQILCVFVFVAITYLMTAQPLELFRIGLFYLIAVMVTLVSQGWGMIVGAACDVKHGMVFGPFVIAPFLVFSGFFIHFADAHVSLHWLFHISYLRYALEGATLAIFGYDRPNLVCNKIYCHFRMPKKFIKEVDMNHNDFMTVLIILLIICCLLRTVAFFIMSFRVKRR